MGLQCLLLLLRGEDHWVATVVVGVVVDADIIDFQLDGPDDRLLEEHKIKLLEVQVDDLTPSAIGVADQGHPDLFETDCELHGNILLHLLVLVVVSAFSELQSLLASNAVHSHQNHKLPLPDIAADD